MVPSCGVRVVVQFAETARPSGYIVHIEPESGEAVAELRCIILCQI
jgi:hypothetical protein